MTKLEFINKLIKEHKESKDRFILAFERYSNDEVVTRCIKAREQEIQFLEQIKNVLEAWEVVAPALIEGKLVGLSYFLKNDIEKFNTIKKALEVNDD